MNNIDLNALRSRCSPEDKAALARSKPSLFRKIRRILKSSNWRDQTVTKGEVYDLISGTPLGYFTEAEHERLERFADRLCGRVILMNSPNDQAQARQANEE